MITTKRLKILVVDKKNNFSIYFKGFRKNKFTINSVSSVLKHSENELNEIGLFFVVLYEPKDMIQLVKLSTTSKSIVLATSNKRLLASLKNISEFQIVDLSSKSNIMSNLHLALTRFL
jgi:hypothetical protein